MNKWLHSVSSVLFIIFGIISATTVHAQTAQIGTVNLAGGGATSCYSGPPTSDVVPIYNTTGSQAMPSNFPNSGCGLGEFTADSITLTNASTIEIECPLVSKYGYGSGVQTFTGPGTLTPNTSASYPQGNSCEYHFNNTGSGVSGNLIALASIQVTKTVTGLTLASLSASSGLAGSDITLTGTGFALTGNTVTFTSGTHVYTQTLSSSLPPNNTTLNATMPSSAPAGTYTVTVTNTAGTSNPETFTVTVPLSLTSINPANGPVETTVTLTGTGFLQTASNRIYLESVDEALTPDYDIYGLSSSNGTTLTFKVPSTVPSGQKYFVLVSIDGGKTWSNHLYFTVTDPSVPSNLTATLVINPLESPTEELTPGIKLTWKDTTPPAAGFQVARTAGEFTDEGSVFDTIGNTTAGVTSFFDDLQGATSTSQIYEVRAKLANGSYGEYSQVASVAACSLVAGSASAPDGIVFVKGDEWNVSPSEYLLDINNIIQNGYLSIDPFKTYGSKLAFYIDTVPFRQASLGKKSDYYVVDSDDKIINGSSCGARSFEYVFLFEDPSIYQAYAGLVNRVAFINMGDIVSDDNSGVVKQVPNWISGSEQLPLTVIHESGHAVGGLTDEYYNPGSTGTDIFIGENCSLIPFDDFHNNIDGHMYGSVDLDATSTQGCRYSATGSLASDTAQVSNKISEPISEDLSDDEDESADSVTEPITETDSAAVIPMLYYRPSSNSIMGHNFPDEGYDFYNEYNVISCGYMVAAILNEPRDKPHAQLHWAAKDLETGGIGCDSPSMNTTKDGIPALDQTAPSSVVVSGGDTLVAGDPTITGKGFTPKGNSIQLFNSTSGAIIYEADGLSSPDGKTLTFTIPATTTPGKYSLKVGAFNSPWSKPITVTVLQATTTLASTTPVTTTGTTTPVKTACPSGYTCALPATTTVKTVIVVPSSSPSPSPVPTVSPMFIPPSNAPSAPVPSYIATPSVSTPTPTPSSSPSPSLSPFPSPTSSSKPSPSPSSSPSAFLPPQDEQAAAAILSGWWSSLFGWVL